MNNASVSVGVQIFVLVPAFNSLIYQEMELLDHMLILLNFLVEPPYCFLSKYFYITSEHGGEDRPREVAKVHVATSSLRGLGKRPLRTRVSRGRGCQACPTADSAALPTILGWACPSAEGMETGRTWEIRQREKPLCHQ